MPSSRKSVLPQSSIYPSAVKNKDLIAAAGAIKPLVHALKISTPPPVKTPLVPSSASLGRRAKIAISRSGAIESRQSPSDWRPRAKKDASLLSTPSALPRRTRSELCRRGSSPPPRSYGRFRIRHGRQGRIRSLCRHQRPGRSCRRRGGDAIPVLVEIVEVGTQRRKRSLSDSSRYLPGERLLPNTGFARRRPPSLVALSQSGSSGAKQKAEALIELLRQPRTLSAASGRRGRVKFVGQD
ncbi:hypothetical protein HPP92_026348 [Vanilla planifolia]|uniref:Uncharacterized protein n=1 Tax=Vanilla planifolia TaxID=51239 RepID=A0A835U7F7_VANPL|nr:hypothetical protein HPP92_026348 [Vanilla planifolia]